VILRIWLVRISTLFRKNRLEQDLDQDIQEHLQMATEENLRRGMSPREAADAARRSFGGPEQMKEEFRDQRGIPFLETLSRELRFAIRSLRRAPGFTALTILTLAVGIGANSAIFSAVNALLFHPAGVTDPSRVVIVRARYDKLNLKDLVISLDNFREVNDSKEIFSAAAVARTGEFSYLGGVYPQRLSSLAVTCRWFEVFGAEPAHGRVFEETECQPGNNRVVILSHAAWQRVFGGDPSFFGKTIDLDGRPYRVIGVMRPEYVALTEVGGLNAQPPDVFVPSAIQETPRTRFIETFLGAARLQRGIPFTRAQSHMGVLTERGFQVPGVGPLRRQNGWGLAIVPYTNFTGGEMKTPMLILWGAVGLVLLIACANIAGLMLARASARARELAVRSALGGTRWHLLRHILAESFVLALAGSTLGLCVAYGFVRSVEVFAPENIAGGLNIPFDLSMLLYTAAAGLLSAVLFGIAPAADFWRGNTSEALKEGARSGTPGRDRSRLRSVLVTAEVALALVLSIGAGLLLRSLTRMQQVDPGLRPEGVMSAAVALPEARYRTPESVPVFFREVIQRLKTLPGATSAAAAYPLPFGPGYEGRAFQIGGRDAREGDPAMQANLRLVTPEFFATLGIPVKRGRVFTEQDAVNTERVAIIDETLARQYWPNEDPLGQRVTLQFQAGMQATIVGIVGHTRQSDLEPRSDQGVFYYPFYQQPLAFATFIVQTGRDRAVPASVMREAVNAIDPAQPIYDAKSMAERVSATLAGRRFTVALLGLFALIAVFLAALGLYGVINYGVTQRTQEIGIRVALGAGQAQVLGLIVGQGMRITLIGLCIGLLAAFWIAPWFPIQLFGVSTLDPVTFATMAMVLAAVALFASYVPARRAVKLDPVEACRYE
jgi:putative ABC transport system permease protein